MSLPKFGWSRPIGKRSWMLLEAIDRVLTADPLDAGESRTGGRRILITPPLAVIFNVSVEDLTVVVTRVRCSRRER